MDIVVACGRPASSASTWPWCGAGSTWGSPAVPGQCRRFDPADAVAAFLQQHYAVHPAPGRILVSPPATEEEGGDNAAGGTGRPRRAVLEPRSVVHRTWVEMAIQNARLAIVARNQAAAQQEQRLAALQAALELSEPPQRIECFDISHTQGERRRWPPCVVTRAMAEKADYRRFNIRDIAPGDDYAAMRQAVSRRYDKVAAGEGRRPISFSSTAARARSASARGVLADLGLGAAAHRRGQRAKRANPAWKPWFSRRPGRAVAAAAGAPGPAPHPGNPRRGPPLRHHPATAPNAARPPDLQAGKPARHRPSPAQGPGRPVWGLPGVLAASPDQLGGVPGSAGTGRKIYAALH